MPSERFEESWLQKQGIERQSRIDVKGFVTNKPDFKPLKTASSKQDEQAWTDLKRSLREQYPNAQRKGCPQEAILKGLAYGNLKLAEVEVWLDHLSQCSPCFCDFERFKAEAYRKRIVRAAFSAAAILLVAVSITLWLKLHHAPQGT